MTHSCDPDGHDSMWEVQGRIGHALPWELVGSCSLPGSAFTGSAHEELPLHFGLVCHGAVGKEGEVGDGSHGSKRAAVDPVSATFTGFKTMTL